MGSEKHQEFAEAIKSWYFQDDPEKMIMHLRGRFQQLHDDYWEIRRENIDLWHENKMLREGHVPESASWLMSKIAGQRRAIRELRKKLGYKDSQHE